MGRTYQSPWMEEVHAEEVITVDGFGSLWMIRFDEEEDAEDANFEAAQEHDAKAISEDLVARKFKSRYLVVRGNMSEIWTSSRDEGLLLLGAHNTLFE